MRKAKRTSHAKHQHKETDTSACLLGRVHQHARIESAIRVEGGAVCAAQPQCGGRHTQSNTQACKKALPACIVQRACCAKHTCEPHTVPTGSEWGERCNAAFTAVLQVSEAPGAGADAGVRGNSLGRGCSRQDHAMLQVQLGKKWTVCADKSAVQRNTHTGHAQAMRCNTSQHSNLPGAKRSKQAHRRGLPSAR
jgi:hypothetical protein